MHSLIVSSYRDIASWLGARHICHTTLTQLMFTYLCISAGEMYSYYPAESGLSVSQSVSLSQLL